MKFLRPRSVDSGLVTVLLVSDAELAMLIDGLSDSISPDSSSRVLQDDAPLKKLRAELETARKAL